MHKNIERKENVDCDVRLVILWTERKNVENWYFLGPSKTENKGVPKEIP